MRNNGWPTPSMRSPRASFLPRRTTCIAARRALTRPCAGRITSVTSEMRLPFEDDGSSDVRLKPDPTYDNGSSEIRLKPDPTYDDGSSGVRRQPDLPDAAARRAAVDPSQNIVLEASAGTGKTRVLVERYVNLLLAGVDPDNILAITFTRKAATEMRQRIIERLKEAGRTSQLSAATWKELRERLGDIA